MRTSIVVHLSLFPAAACGDAPDGPAFCLLAADDPRAATRDDCDQPSTPQPGQPFRLLHVVDDRLEPADVTFLFETPCGREEERIRNTRGVVSVVRTAPPGAECSLGVTASLFQSDLRQESVGEDCTTVEQTCPGAEVDAGGPDAGE